VTGVAVEVGVDVGLVSVAGLVVGAGLGLVVRAGTGVVVALVVGLVVAVGLVVTVALGFAVWVGWGAAFPTGPATPLGATVEPPPPPEQSERIATNATSAMIQNPRCMLSRHE
jgi:hypothetical protein